MTRRLFTGLAAAGAANAAPPLPDAPKFRAKSVDGAQFSNESLKGKVVLIQFWATWCGYCRRDEPGVEQIIKEFGDKGLVVLAVNVGEDTATVGKYLGRFKRTAKIVLQQDTDLVRAFAAGRGFPQYEVINREGKHAARQDGSGGLDGLRELIGEAGLK